MWPTSARFRETVTGSHRAVSRVQLLTTTEFGAAPTGGREVPILSGNVKLSSTSDIKATVDLSVPGDWWDALQPFGAELFVQRGVTFGDSTRELVPLGYYRIDRVVQDRAPDGPITVDGSDRIAQMRQNRVLYPYQVAEGATHRYLFERLVNGRAAAADQPSTLGYGMFIHTPVPILWTRAGYSPDTAVVNGSPVVEDSTYEFLAKLVDARGCVLRFLPTGELSVEPRDPSPDAPVVYRITAGSGGTLISASRSVSRDGVYNIVAAHGSDPAASTGYRLAYNTDRTSPLWWEGRFGAAPRYYASPLLRTSAEAAAGAESILARYTGLPTETSVYLVPDPSIQPVDVISAPIGGLVGTRVVDEVSIPLAGQEPVSVKARTLNPVGTLEGDEPEPPPPGPTPDPDPPPGGGDPSDGTQAAVLLGWGVVVDGDEFAYSGAPGPKWAMYNGPGHAGNGLRRPSAFNVAGGVLTCTGDNVAGGTSGGMAFRRDEKYCRIEVRMRTYSINPSAPGNRYHPVLITWPTSNQWPQGGEYDFFETNCDSGKLGWFLHYPNHQPKVQEGGEKPLDIQNWHNYAFEWAPTGLRGWCDGVKYFEYTMAAIQAPGPMHLTFQLDNFFGANMCPAKMEAQWVRIYNRPG